MGSERARRLAIVTGIAAMLWSHAAAAQSTAADRETARALMREGRELRDRGELASALKEFEAANEIMHVPTTELEVARTQAALGLLVEALDTIATIRRTPAAPDEPQPFTDARAKAVELDATLESQVPALTIVLRPADEHGAPTVSIDGIGMPSARRGIPYRLDPGHHVIVAKVGTTQVAQEVDLNAGDQRQISLALVGVDPVPPEVVATHDPPRARPLLTPGRRDLLLTATAASLTGAAIVVGAVTGLMSWSKKSSLAGECPHFTCPSGAASGDLDSANTLAQASNVSFVLAGIGAVVTVASLVWGTSASARPRASSPGHGSRIRAWIGVGAAGVHGDF
jgi:hypothetical protein